LTTFRRLLALADIPRRRAALAVVLGSCAVAFGIGLLATSGYLISRAAEQPPVLSLTVAIVCVRFFALARPLARYLDRLVSHDIALRSLGRIRARLYRKLEPLAPGELGSHRGGDLLSRFVSDVDALQGLYLRGLAPPLVAVVVGTAAVLATALLLPSAALVLAAGLLVGGIAVPAVAAAAARRSGRHDPAARGELTVSLVELLRGAPELVVNGREASALARIDEQDEHLTRLGRRDAGVAGLADSMSALVAGLTLCGVLAVAVDAHAAGALDRVLVGTLALLALASFECVAPLPGAARELAATLAAGRRVLELTGRRPTIRDPETPRPGPSGRPAVALEHVTARYPGETQAALAGFDLRLEPGQHLALVGPSGAGKTTVANMLFRFLDPEEGRVAIDGVDIRELRLDDVRATFALAGQEAHVFDSSIRENLLLARPQATEGELEAALDRAQLRRWVGSLPDGLDTIVGEDGGRLSGGQRQRLVLARALLSDAPVLVLDEPTAHLDEATARRLVDDVLDGAGDRSVLLITHRSEGLERMDEVLALPPARPRPDTRRAAVARRRASGT
jgi:thiol reductant ABC exporter CydC subunit